MILATTASACMCVCEDLAIILHAWCLYLAGPSPLLSLPLFLNLSPCVDVSAYPGLCLCILSEQKFYILIHSAPSVCVCVYALRCLSLIYNQRQTRYIQGKMSTNPFSLLSWFKCGRVLEAQICNQALLACIIKQTKRQRYVNREKK